MRKKRHRGVKGGEGLKMPKIVREVIDVICEWPQSERLKGILWTTASINYPFITM